MARSYILGIESSCDESAAAIVGFDGEVKSSVIYSQLAEHAPFGGVVPEIAARAHLDKLPHVIRQSLGESHINRQELAAIAVTQGPGLGGALLCGLHMAQALAFAWDLPVIGIDHLHAHLLSPWLKTATHRPHRLAYPYLALLVSGGHSAFYQVTNQAEARLLGQTRDDAVGEAFDKAAKTLGLPYPGGPAIASFAQQDPGCSFRFSPVRLKSGGFDLSFSGLKTALIQALPTAGHDEQGRRHLAWAFQEAIVRTLRDKLSDIVNSLEPAFRPQHVALVGGVAANTRLREVLGACCSDFGIALTIPPVDLCTDNAAMIAYAGTGIYRSAAANRGLTPQRPTTATMLDAYTRDKERSRGPTGPLSAQTGANTEPRVR